MKINFKALLIPASITSICMVAICWVLFPQMNSLRDWGCAYILSCCSSQRGSADPLLVMCRKDHIIGRKHITDTICQSRYPTNDRQDTATLSLQFRTGKYFWSISHDYPTYHTLAITSDSFWSISARVLGLLNWSMGWTKPEALYGPQMSGAQHQLYCHADPLLSSWHMQTHTAKKPWPIWEGLSL